MNALVQSVRGNEVSHCVYEWDKSKIEHRKKKCISLSKDQSRFFFLPCPCLSGCRSLCDVVVCLLPYFTEIKLQYELADRH